MQQLLVANADGTEAITLLPAGGHGIVWSPDSTKLVYLAAERHNLFVHDFAADRATRLLDSACARLIRGPYVDIGPNDADFRPRRSHGNLLPAADLVRERDLGRVGGAGLRR